MDLHFLINISSETENHYGVKFFNSFFKNCHGTDVTLFHVCHSEDPDSSSSILEVWDAPADIQNGKLTPSARVALDRAQRTLVGNDLKIRSLRTKTIKEQFGKVKDILTEGAKGLYDAMILGRRATYTLQWMFDRPGDEIPKALTQDASLACPVWICSEPESGRRNVLLCVDGSRSSLRAADHVGYVLSRARHHKVTVFHVTTTRTSNIQRILEEAETVLLSHGVEPERISSKRGWGLSIPGAILSEKNQGQYAAVALGLHGISQGRLLENIGIQEGIAATLIKKIDKAALWCCP